jgi:hypothetical protein
MNFFLCREYEYLLFRSAGRLSHLTLLASNRYLDPGAQFELVTQGSRPKLQRGQMTKVYEAIARLKRPTIPEIVTNCRLHGYIETFSNPETDITASVLYHIKRLEEGTLGRVKRAQDPVIRAV